HMHFCSSVRSRICSKDPFLMFIPLFDSCSLHKYLTLEKKKIHLFLHCSSL
ncbi:hypothetical protein S83_070285, partial [Arachis hypogaea]